MHLLNPSLLVVATIGLVACTDGAKAVVDQPSSITLRDALVSSVEAISASRTRAAELRALNDGVPLGMNVCSLKATFNITAEGTTKSGIDGSVSTPKDLYVSATVDANRSDTLVGHRGNQIEVVFTSPACNPPETLGTKSPKDVVLLEREIEAAREGAPDPLHVRPGAGARSEDATGGSPSLRQALLRTIADRQPSDTEASLPRRPMRHGPSGSPGSSWDPLGQPAPSSHGSTWRTPDTDVRSVPQTNTRMSSPPR